MASALSITVGKGRRQSPSNALMNRQKLDNPALQGVKPAADDLSALQGNVTASYDPELLKPFLSLGKSDPQPF